MKLDELKKIIKEELKSILEANAPETKPGTKEAPPTTKPGEKKEKKRTITPIDPKEEPAKAIKRVVNRYINLKNG